MSKSNCFYFFVYFPRNQKVNDNDIDFVKHEDNNNIPECIYSVEDYANSTYYYKKIFKATKTETKGKKIITSTFEFIIGEEIYIISFKGSNSFIFDVNLLFGKKNISIRRKIDQSIVEYSEKLDIFIEALNSNEEKEKIDNLFKDALDLYSEKKGFSFLISLFLKIYEKKDLCSVLLKKFRDMNGVPKDNEKNMDRKEYLNQYTSKFIQIKSEAEKLINNNGYESIEFYGILLCYLNFYAYKDFLSLFDELSDKKELYEILLIYNKHLINPINQKLDFLTKFFDYTIKNKEFEIFKNALNYIKDIETFIAIIETNKKNIYDMYIKPDQSEKKNEKYIIKLGKN